MYMYFASVWFSHFLYYIFEHHGTVYMYSIFTYVYMFYKKNELEFYLNFVVFL